MASKNSNSGHRILGILAFLEVFFGFTNNFIEFVKLNASINWMLLFFGIYILLILWLYRMERSKWIIVVLTIVLFVIETKLYCNATCCCSKTEFAVVVSDFSKDDSDGLSNAIIENLETNMPKADSIKLESFANFIPTLTGNEKLVEASFKNGCFNHGLLVLGENNKGNKIFRCGIYVNNVRSLTNDSVIIKSKSGPVIYISNPAILEVIPKAEMISNFIIGLLYYRGRDFIESKKYFEKALMEISGNSTEDNKVKALCHGFIAATLLKHYKLTEAENELKTASEMDPENTSINERLNQVRNVLNSLKSDASTGDKMETENQPNFDKFDEHLKIIVAEESYKMPFKLDSCRLKIEIEGYPKVAYLITNLYTVIKTINGSTKCSIAGEAIGPDYTWCKVQININKEQNVVLTIKNGIVTLYGRKIGTAKKI